MPHGRRSKLRQLATVAKGNGHENAPACISLLNRLPISGAPGVFHSSTHPEVWVPGEWEREARRGSAKILLPFILYQENN